MRYSTDGKRRRRVDGARRRESVRRGSTPQRAPPARAWTQAPQCGRSTNAARLSPRPNRKCEKSVDLGCGLGYSTLWLAHATGSTGSVVGIDDDPAHIDEAESIAADFGLGDRVSYVTGRASDVLATLTGPVDMIHDDAWFATAPDHLDAMVDLLRPGGLLTMANWFLLVDALTGDQRNDWAAFAGDDWVEQTLAYARNSPIAPT